MGMNCPKCGADNLVTAVFCRSCGEKLDLSAMQPEVLVQEAKKKDKQTGGWLNWLFGGLFSLFLLMFVAALVPPLGFAGAGKLDRKSTANKKFQAMLGDVERTAQLKKRLERDPQNENASKDLILRARLFSAPDTATLLNREVVNLLKRDAGWMHYQKVHVKLNEDSSIAIALKGKAFCFLPLTISARVSVSFPQKGAYDQKLKWSLSSAKVGYLPLIWGMKKGVCAPITYYFSQTKNLQLLYDHVQNVEVVRNQKGELRLKVTYL